MFVKHVPGTRSNIRSKCFIFIILYYIFIYIHHPYLYANWEPITFRNKTNIATTIYKHCCKPYFYILCVLRRYKLDFLLLICLQPVMFACQDTNLTNSFFWQIPSKLLQNHTFSIDLRLKYFNFIFYINLLSNIKNMLSLYLMSDTSTLVLRQIVIFSSHYCLNISRYSRLKYYLFEIEVFLNITYLFILKLSFSFDQIS